MDNICGFSFWVSFLYSFSSPFAPYGIEPVFFVSGTVSAKGGVVFSM
jgi:hypothetical protein